MSDLSSRPQPGMQAAPSVAPIAHVHGAGAADARSRKAVGPDAADGGGPAVGAREAPVRLLDPAMTATILGDGVPFPFDLVVETTTRCNLRCLQCARSWEEMPAEDMPASVFHRVSPLLGGAGRLSLYGHGESFLHPSFLSMLRTARAKAAPVHVVTNGTLLTQETAEQVVGEGLDNLVFSMDAAHAGLFARIRRGAALKQVMSGAARVISAKRRLRSPAPLVGLQMVGMKSNVRELPYLVSLGAAMGCDKVKMVALAEYGELVGESLERHPEEVAPIRRSLALAEQLGVELEICPSYLRLVHKASPEHMTAPEADPEPVPVVATRQCADPWTFAYITSRGEVVPCCGSSRVLGDLRTQEFSSIWRGAAYRQFRQRLLTGDLPQECRSCVLKPPLHLRQMPHRMRVGDNDHPPAPLLWGWHDRERHADGPFRWTASRAALLLEAPGAASIELRLVWPGGGERPLGRIKVDGREVARYRLTKVGEEHVSVPCAPKSGTRLVEIVSDNPRRPVPGVGLPDRRVLGVGVRDVTLA